MVRAGTERGSPPRLLSDDDASYLVHHRVPFSRVLDGSGLKGKALREAMAEAEAWVAVNTGNCRNDPPHRMKLRSGHCFRCKPEGLGFLQRFENAGDVYVAFSEECGLVKVGTAGDVHARIRELNRKRYGGASDWELFFTHAVRFAGRIEADAHAVLCKSRLDRTHFWAGRLRTCYELYSCTADDARRALELVIDESHTID